MQTYFTRDLIQGLIVFQAILLLFILSNIFLLRRARKHSPPKHKPLVSVLVPARNEEENINRCVRSLLDQDYPEYEVLVLDDHSSDGTPTILRQIVACEPRLSVLTGQALPEGWLGKNWACAQLARQAQGELLLFTDADTVHQPQALTELVTALEGEQVDVLSGFPRQVMLTWGERFTVPFFSWAFLSFTPLVLAYRLRLPFLSSAVGQMILFRRSAYEAIGGHASVRDHIAEDLSLVRKATSAGHRWRVTYLTDLISCRMYTVGSQAIQGFSKNYFAAFGFRLLPYLFIFTWMAVTFWIPPIDLALALLGLAPHAQLTALLVCIGMSLLVWAIPYHVLGLGVRLALLYPVTLLFIEVVAIKSLWLSLTGQLKWKGRSLGRPHWKWL